jgi:hypothetical protein
MATGILFYFVRQIAQAPIFFGNNFTIAIGNDLRKLGAQGVNVISG